jgi:hypothetical protein
MKTPRIIQLLDLPEGNSVNSEFGLISVLDPSFPSETIEEEFSEWMEDTQGGGNASEFVDYLNSKWPNIFEVVFVEQINP